MGKAKKYIHLREATDEYLMGFEGMSSKYRQSVTGTLRWLADELGNPILSTIDPGNVENAFARAGSSYAPGTLKLRRSHLSGFFKWAFYRRYIENPEMCRSVRIRKEQKRQWIRATQAEMADLLDAAKNPRDRALVAILFYTGMRDNELKPIRWQDKRNGILHFGRHKTGAAAEMPIAPVLQAELDRWEAHWKVAIGRAPQPGEYLVCARNNRMGQNSSIPARLQIVPNRPIPANTRTIIKPMLATIFPNLEQEGAHTIRRSAARWLLLQAAENPATRHDPIGVVQSFLGHASRDQTVHYVGMDYYQLLLTKLMADLGPTVAPTDAAPGIVLAFPGGRPPVTATA